MSESDFLRDLRLDSDRLLPSIRKQKIRKLTAESKADKKFIMKFFPEFSAGHKELACQQHWNLPTAKPFDRLR